MTNETVDDIYESSRGQIRGHRAQEILPDIDVTEIASAVYDFLSALRRLMDRPNQKLAISQSEIEVLQFISQHPGAGSLILLGCVSCVRRMSRPRSVA